MNKALKTILIISIAVFGAGILFLPSFALANGLIKIDFEQKPLFQETNFLPGESVTHWIEVENKSSETQPIGVEVISYSSCSSDCFSEQLNLIISNGLPDLYNSSLTDFFKAGEIKLSDLAVGAKIKYFFTVTFLPEASNKYQEEEVSFDFQIGALGTESISGEIPPGGGGYFITGLQIFYEKASEISGDSVIITWLTNKSATSRVIYASSSEDHTLQLDNPPNYGYARSSAEDSSLKTDHQMVITGLTPGTTYYYRCVSHTSPDEAISTQHSFTTKAVAGAAEEIVPLLPEAPPLGKEDGIEPEVEGEFIEEEITIGEDKDLDKFLATAGACMAAGNLCWLFFAVIIILTVLYLLSRDKKEKEIKKKDLIFLLIIILLIILYCIFCCSCCWILILVISSLFILFTVLILRRKITEREN